MTGRSDRWKRLALRCTCAAALALSIGGGAAAAKDPKPPSDTAGVRCKTDKVPQPMLGGAEPATHEFHAFPQNRATETGTFSDGATLSIEIKGCTGPTVTTMVLALPGAAGSDKKIVEETKLSKKEQLKEQKKLQKKLAAAEKADKRPERKTIGPLVDYLNANLDAFAKTPLGLPGAARALALINEAKMSYPDGDRICLDKDNPVVVPDAQRCAKVLEISWSSGPHKTYTITYSAD